MANEAVCIETPTKFARYTVADGTGIAKGCLLQISSDPNTASASSASGQVFGGIAWEEKTASDGITQITAALDGVWDLAIGTDTSVTLGAMVSLSGANIIRNSVEADFPVGYTIGRALETGTSAEVIRVRLGAF